MNPVAWLDGQKLGKKILLLAFLALLLAGPPTYLVNRSHNETIATAQGEIDGIDPVRSLLTLIKLMQQHRGFSADLLSGDDAAKAGLDAKNQEVVAAIAKMDAIVKHDLAADKAAKVWGDTSDNWKSLSEGVAQKSLKAKNSNRLHTLLIAQYFELLDLMVDHYGFSYDPEAASYHLIIGSMRDLPRMTEGLGQMRGLGFTYLTAKDMSTNDRGMFAGLRGRVRNDLNDAKNNFSKAIALDDSIKAGFGEMVEGGEASTMEALNLAQEQIIGVNTLEYSPKEWLSTFSSSIDRQYALSLKATELLDGLLENRISTARHQKYTVLGILTALAAMISMIGFVVVRSILQPLNASVAAAERIAAGDFSTDLTNSRKDEFGTLLSALKTMQSNIEQNIADSRRTADEMTRIKIALDNVSTGVMIADNARNIIYTNFAMARLLKDAESAIRSVKPGFNADNVLGQCIDQFHSNPQHQAGMLATLTKTHVAQMELGGRHMVVSASPVMNPDAQRLGSVAEWRDRTAEVIIESEVSAIVAAASSGDLSKRIELAGKEGFYALLSEGLNQLLESTQQSLTATSEVLSRIAQGDLTTTITADFEGIFGQLKHDTNTTIERLREVIGSIGEATEAINTASQEIAAGNVDLSSRTEQQASSLEETSSSMEELNATVKSNAENALKANQLAKNSNEIASRGGAMVKGVVSTMTEIQDSSKKIADIVGVIDSIAFQTNILALNAAVEAARAGEQGRGFAVVATEVRSLAQRSATAAKEIKALIAESVDKVESGAKLVEQAGSTMDEVVASFQGVANLVTEISGASREQSSGIEQVTNAVSQMDEVTQQNAALVEQAAAAAESLEEQARALVKAVGMFNLTGSGSQEGRLALQLPRG
jgi:methyl-accepting chemotaxis protein